MAIRKKTLALFVGLGLLAILGFWGQSIVKEREEADKKVAAREKASLDSMTAVSAAEFEVHKQRMKSDRKYRDSVEKALVIAEKARIDQERLDSPEKYLETTASWRKGGFGSIAFVTVKFDNKSLKACVNPKVACVLKSSNGTALDTKIVEIPETFRAGTKTKSSEISLGFISAQVDALTVEFLAATWE